MSEPSDATQEESVGDGASEFTTGSVPRRLLRMSGQSLPAFAAWEGGEMVALFCIAAVGVAELAAYGFVHPIAQLIFWLSAAVLANAAAPFILDADKANAKRFFTHFMMLVGLTSLIGAALWWRFLDPMLEFVGTPPEIVPSARAFVAIYTAAYPLICLSTTGPELLGTRGVVKPIAKHVVIASAIVVAGFPFFILGIGPFPRLGFAGMAAAIMVGRVYMTALTFWVAWKHGLFGRPEGGWFHGLGTSWKKIFKSCGWQGYLLLICVGMILPIIVRLVSEFGVEAVAAFCVGNRLSTFFMVPTMAAIVGVPVMVSRAWRAGLKDRLREVLYWGRLISLISAVVSVAVVVAVAPWIADLFVTDGGSDFREELIIAIILFPAIGGPLRVAKGDADLLNEMGRENIRTALAIFRLVCVVLSVWVAMQFFGTFFGICLGYLAGECINAAMYIITSHSLLARMPSENVGGSAPFTGGRGVGTD